MSNIEGISSYVYAYMHAIIKEGSETGAVLRAVSASERTAFERVLATTRPELYRGLDSDHWRGYLFMVSTVGTRVWNLCNEVLVLDFKRRGGLGFLSR